MGSGEYGDEFSGSIKCKEYSEYLRNISFSRKSLHHGVSKEKNTIKNQYFLNRIYAIVL